MNDMVIEEEPLLSLDTFTRPVNTANRKRALMILFVSFLIACCLVFYIYLNIRVFEINESQQISKPLSRRKPMLNHESIYFESGPSMISINDLLAHCIVALKTAGIEVVNSSLLKNDILHNIDSKGKTKEGVDDIVTSVDVKSSDIIKNSIRDSYRRLKIVSEEDDQHQFGHDQPVLPIERVKFANDIHSNKLEIESDKSFNDVLLPQNELLVWIDPLDATKEYSENLTQYVTLMACIVHKQTPIAGIIHKPFTQQTYWSLTDKSQKLAKLSPHLKHVISLQNSHQNNTNNINIIISRSHAGDIKNVLNELSDYETNIVPAGGSGFKAIEVASGFADAYLHITNIKKWDICAPYSIINSLSGGKLSTFKGNRIYFGNSSDQVMRDGLIATTQPYLHEKLTNLLKTKLD